MSNLAHTTAGAVTGHPSRRLTHRRPRRTRAHPRGNTVRTHFPSRPIDENVVVGPSYERRRSYDGVAPRGPFVRRAHLRSCLASDHLPCGPRKHTRIVP